jgi:hypothetical protein
MIAVITRAFEISNYIEAALWSSIGIGFAIAAITHSGITRRRCWIAAVTFVLFGISDLVEAHTGAWYRPLWLLAWKGVCVLVLGYLMLVHFRDHQRSR